MAWIEHRARADGDRWRVLWRQNGQKQQQSFPDEASALDFQAGVNANGNRWPRGWVKGQGWADEIGESDEQSFRDYAKATLAARGRADPRTRADYTRLLANHVDTHLGDIPINKITRFHVAKVSQAMARKGLSAKTINNVHSLVSSILSDAVADELLRRNPARGAMPNLPDVRTEEMVFLSPGEFQLVTARIPEGVYRDLARFLAGTGMRWSEATALQVGDVEILDRKVAHVRRAWKRREGKFVVGSPKTNRSRRSITLSSELVDLLLAHVAAKNPAELVFMTPQGRRVSHSNFYNRIWRPAVARARRCDEHRTAAEPCGCAGTLTKSPRIHDLRHAHASWLLADKVTLPAIQRRLGHESIETTINRYGHLAPEHGDEIDASVNKALAHSGL